MDARLELLKKQLASKAKDTPEGNANNENGESQPANQEGAQKQEGNQEEKQVQAQGGQASQVEKEPQVVTPEGSQEPEVKPEGAQEKVLKDEDILKMISEKTGREVKAWDDLTPKEQQEIKFASPEVEAFNQFAEKTGRGLNDYLSLKQDRSNDPAEKVVMDYWKSKYPDLSVEDLEFKMSRTFNLESEDEDDKRAGAIELKSVAAEARRYFDAERAKLNEPSREVQERQAKAQQEAELLKKQQEAFQSGMERSLENMHEVQLGDHVHKFNVDNYKGKIGSLDSVLSLFNDGNGNFQFDKFAKAIVVGLEIDSVAKAIQDSSAAKAMEESMKNHNNHGGTASGYSRSVSSAQPSDGQKRTEQQIKNRFKIT